MVLHFCVITGTTLDAWMKNIRTQYGKIKKRERSGAAARSSTHRQKWILASLDFLDRHMLIRTKMQSLGINESPSAEKNVVHEQEDSEEEDAEDEGDQVTVSSTSQTTSTTTSVTAAGSTVPTGSTPRSTSGRRRAAPKSEINDAFVAFLKNFSVTKTQELSDSRKSFVNYLNTEVSALTSEQFDDFQTEVTNLLIRYRSQRRQVEALATACNPVITQTRSAPSQQQQQQQATGQAYTTIPTFQSATGYQQTQFPQPTNLPPTTYQPGYQQGIQQMQQQQPTQQIQPYSQFQPIQMQQQQQPLQTHTSQSFNQSLSSAAAGTTLDFSDLMATSPPLPTASRPSSRASSVHTQHSVEDHSKDQETND